MTIADLISAIEQIAPPSYAEDWDNVGLLVGRRADPLRAPTLLTIDLTEEVLAEALRRKAGAIVAYHPPIFSPINRITGDDARARTLLAAIEARIAIYSPHTALDAVPGGVTDWLCDMLAPDDRAALGDAAAASSAGPSSAIGDRRALIPRAACDPNQTHKIVTFLPAEHVDRVRDALASVGAGVIGAYQLCSFSLKGEGTFFAPESASPAVGQTGRLERVSEVRLEMVCPARALGLAAEMLRQFHPYEEPAWEIYPLAPKPDRTIGAGRRLTLDRPATSTELAKRLKKALGVDAVQIARAPGGDTPVTRIGVCPGAGASLLDAAIEQGCQAFVTGEMKHHEAASAVARGCSIIIAGHTNTERGYLPTLAGRINELAPHAQAFVSEADKTLFRTL